MVGVRWARRWAKDRVLDLTGLTGAAVPGARFPGSFEPSAVRLPGGLAAAAFASAFSLASLTAEGLRTG